MIRRLFITILALLPLAVSAQLAVGTWRQFPVFGDIDEILETPHYVYYVTGGFLYSYDKDNDETRVYDTTNELSDVKVSKIVFNDEKNYLLVVYANSNIDLLYHDGRRVNLPDIKDANLNMSKTVNDVKFYGDLIYVATNFGLVIYDETRHEVKESGIYNQNIAGVAVFPNHCLITTEVSDEIGRFLAIPRSQRINNINNFTPAGDYNYPVTELRMLDASKGTMVSTNRGHIRTFSFNDATGKAAVHYPGKYTTITRLIPGKDAVFFVEKGVLYRVSADETITQECVIPSALSADLLATLNGASSIWAGGREGVGQYKVDGSNLTVLSDRFNGGSDRTTFGEICNIYPTSDGRGFYVINKGITYSHPIGNDNPGNRRTFCNLITTRGGNYHIDDVTPYGIIPLSDPAQSQVRAHGPYIYGPSFVVEDPDDTSRLYFGSLYDGVYVLKDGKQIGQYNENSPIVKYANWAWGPDEAAVDSEGNLWVVSFISEAELNALTILPADKRRKDPSTVTAQDWVVPNLGHYLKFYDYDLLICRKSNMAFMADAQEGGAIVAYNNGGTVSNLSDDSYAILDHMIDQDGKAFSPAQTICFVEDQRGRVWVGTSQGVIEITNPLKATQPDFRINRLKVPRNDGSNLADYLLESEEIRDIVVDNSNRKWIATRASGLYLVSENGDEILANYTTDNSPLTSNTITTLYADPNSNSIFVGTLNGLLEFSSTSSPARDDYSDVYAYPNPLTPDYTGWVTISGLMENSLVKIMDSGMHLVYQTTSEGGMARWDGCTMQGSRVKSGVYYVLASSASDTSSQGDVVTKILVVN